MKRIRLFLTIAFLLSIPFNVYAQRMLYGDVNGDLEVNIADINAIINIILEGSNVNDTFDVNGDCEVNIADINAIINIILGIDPNLPSEGTDLPGLYMGITGFNQQLYTKDISLLNRDTKGSFTNFVSSLSTQDATVLYYAVDKSLDALNDAPYPINLSNVAIVTFTDGLDQGSLMLTDKGYSSDVQYAAALSSRICSMMVHGCPLQAYSIGLKGSDVTNDAMFMSSLHSLATGEDNVALVNDISEVTAQFNSIANHLVEKSSTYSHALTLTIPGISNGTRIRFTFDHISSTTVAQSQCFIEGTFNLGNRSLTDVIYHGMACSNGTIVMPKSVNGVYITYAFDDVVLDDPAQQIDKNIIKEWYWMADYNCWQLNSEFTPSCIDNMEVETNYTSAIVMLVLDCSASLSSVFYSLQSAAIKFINILSNYESYKPDHGYDDHGHEWVDLGLPSGTLWATCNLGANNPEEYGDYFAWGETEPKDYYVWSNYKWCKGDNDTFTKYCTNHGYNGFYDGKTELDLEDDAAYVNWGASWRMPSREQQRELFEQCTWTWLTQNGVDGRLATGPNGKTIFLPAGGSRWDDLLNNAGLFGYYRSRTLCSNNSIYSYSLFFDSSIVHCNVYGRSSGESIRAVFVSQK